MNQRTSCTHPIKWGRGERERKTEKERRKKDSRRKQPHRYASSYIYRFLHWIGIKFIRFFFKSLGSFPTWHSGTSTTLNIYEPNVPSIDCKWAKEKKTVATWASNLPFCCVCMCLCIASVKLGEINVIYRHRTTSSTQHRKHSI